MSKKATWSWIAIIGFIIMMVGSILAFIPFVGLPLMVLGTVLMIIAVIVILPILIRERRKDNKEMRSEISEKELRP